MPKLKKDDRDLDWFSFHPDKFYFGVNELPEHIIGRYIMLLIQQWRAGTTSKSAGRNNRITIVGKVLSMEKVSDPTSEGSSEGTTDPNSEAISTAIRGVGGRYSFATTIEMDEEAIFEAISKKFQEVGAGRFQNQFLELMREESNQRIELYRINKVNGSKGGRAKAQKFKQNSSEGSSGGISDGSSEANSEPSRVAISETLAGVLPKNSTAQHSNNNTLTPIIPFSKKINAETADAGSPPGEIYPGLHLVEKSIQIAGNDPILLSFRLDEGFTSKEVLRVLKSSVDGLVMNTDLPKRPPQFIKFVFERWVGEVIAQKLELAEGKLRQHFRTFINFRLTELEKSFEKYCRDGQWFQTELNKAVKPEMDPALVASFAEYYLTVKEAGNMHYQGLANFSMERELNSWMADKGRKINGHKKSKSSEPDLSDVAKMSLEQKREHYNKT